MIVNNLHAFGDFGPFTTVDRKIKRCQQITGQLILRPFGLMCITQAKGGVTNPKRKPGNSRAWIV